MTARSKGIVGLVGLVALAACAAPDQQLESRVAALEHAPPPAAPVAAAPPEHDRDADVLAAIAELDTRLDRIAKKLDDIAARLPSTAPSRRPEPDRTVTYSVPIEDDPVVGSADAKVTMVIACDYASPYCEKIRDTVDELHKKYASDLRVVYKQFVVHPQVARASALAACAANRQHRFADMDALLWDKGFKGRSFDTDDSTGGHCWAGTAGCPIVLGFAADLKLDATKFKADMKACDTNVDRDIRQLQVLGVGATPSFFINGRFMSGAMPIENFTALIDEELAKANDRVKGGGVTKATYYKKFVIDAGVKTLSP